MSEFVVMSPCYELLRYGHDLIDRQTADAHAQRKQSKFVFGPADLIDPGKPPTPDNFRFEARQVEAADVAIFAGKTERPLQDNESWGRRRKHALPAPLLSFPVNGATKTAVGGQFKICPHCEGFGKGRDGSGKIVSCSECGGIGKFQA